MQIAIEMAGMPSIFLALQSAGSRKNEPNALLNAVSEQKMSTDRTFIKVNNPYIGNLQVFLKVTLRQAMSMLMKAYKTIVEFQKILGNLVIVGTNLYTILELFRLTDFISTRLGIHVVVDCFKILCQINTRCSKNTSLNQIWMT